MAGKMGADQHFFAMEAASARMAEAELGTLATTTCVSDEVKTFGSADG
jgi:hypothetical protein